MNNEQITLITEVARKSVDTAVEQSIKDGTDILDAIKGAILYHREALHWAEEIERIETERRSK